MYEILTTIKLLSLSISCSILPAFSAISQDFSSVEFAAENVKSITFEKDGLLPSYPFIQPWNGEEMTLHFDITGSHTGSLWYRLTHCDRDWNMSDLFTSDYIEGFDENQITDYLPSFNTRVNYTHYSLKLPNDDIRFQGKPAHGLHLVG